MVKTRPHTYADGRSGLDDLESGVGVIRGVDDGVVENVGSYIADRRERDGVVGHRIVQIGNVRRHYDSVPSRSFTCQCDDVALCRSEAGAHGNLTTILRNAESVVVHVRLQITDEVVGRHVSDCWTSLNRRVDSLNGSILALLLRVRTTPDRSRGRERVLQNNGLRLSDESSDGQGRRCG